MSDFFIGLIVGVISGGLIAAVAFEGALAGYRRAYDIGKKQNKGESQ